MLMPPVLSEIDPLQKGEGSIDPLGLAATYERLANQMLENVTVRMSRIRFVTALAVGTAVCEAWEEDERASDGVSSPWQVFEWATVMAFVKAREAGGESVLQVAGSQKVQRALRAQYAISAKTYLKTPTVFGFGGIFRRFAVGTQVIGRDARLEEAGHALVGMNVPQHDPLHKVTIIPRGRALGVTMNLPEQDRLSYTRQYCVSKLASMFGGREAEVLIFGPENVTNGAVSDIQQATRMARAMIMEWGMSDKLGRVRYNGNEQEVFLGHSVTQTKNISDETAKLIDEEIRDLIKTGEGMAKHILNEKIDGLHALANALLEHETLSGDEVKAVMRGEKIERASDDSGSKGSTGSAVPSAGRQRKLDFPSPPRLCFEEIGPQLASIHLQFSNLVVFLSPASDFGDWSPQLHAVARHKNAIEQWNRIGPLSSKIFRMPNTK